MQLLYPMQLLRHPCLSLEPPVPLHGQQQPDMTLPGTQRLVFVKAVSAVTVNTPTNDPALYNASTDFTSPIAPNYQWDAGAKCIYKGDGTSTTITNLSAGVTYHVLVLTVVDAVNSDANGLTNSYSAYATTTATTGNIYYWNGIAMLNDKWGRPGNWLPVRTTPAATDILIINNGGTFTIDSVSQLNETIAQLQVINNTTVTLRCFE